ncbi:MAG: ornithine cyclodeaminase [Planctomycetaceae bacterium]|nr:MAG: ornithine cyclodeaminase [Planctomycetaceae bacterium]
MSVLFLTEDDVAWLLDLPSAIEIVERVFLGWQRGEVDNQPRRRVSLPGAMLHVMSAAVHYAGYLGVKAYLTTRSVARFHLLLYRAETGTLEAIVEANHLGRVRTGATSAVATRHMAIHSARVVGCFGTGFQARTQLQAICQVRRIESIEVYSRREEHRQRFAEEMTELCNLPVAPVPLPDQAAADKDIVITATSSRTPVFDGRVLSEGTHINAIGSNFLNKAELDVTTVRRADHVVCDNLEACQLEAGDLVPAVEAGVIDWPRVKELRDVVAGLETGRATDSDITLFKSVGLAMEDVAVGVHVLQRAQQERIGQSLPL